MKRFALLALLMLTFIAESSARNLNLAQSSSSSNARSLDATDDEAEEKSLTDKASDKYDATKDAAEDKYDGLSENGKWAAILLGCLAAGLIAFLFAFWCCCGCACDRLKVVICCQSRKEDASGMKDFS